MRPNTSLKFIYSEKATKFCEIFPLLLTTVRTVKSKGKIPQNLVAFSKYMNFNEICMSPGDLLIWQNFEVRIFGIVYFQQRKREFDWSTFFCWTNKRPIFSVKKSKYQNFIKKATHWMTYKEQKKNPIFE